MISKKFSPGQLVYYVGYRGTKHYGTVASEDMIRQKHANKDYPNLPWTMKTVGVFGMWGGVWGHMSEDRVFTDEFEYVPSQEGDKEDDI